jgi:hypothetical protein
VTSIKKVGDWENIKSLVNNMHKDLEASRLIALKRWGLLAEGIAIKHISSQDLNWEALQPSTISGKVRLGYSENILVRSSTYFSSITSYVRKDTALAGVKKEAKYADGEKVANIAAIHEYGSPDRNIPARPLWEPTLNEARTIIKKDKKFDPTAIFLAKLRLKI